MKKRILALTLATTLGLSACSTDATNSTSGDSGTKDNPTVTASTSVWADVATAVLGDQATIHAIVANSDIDPHSFEPSASDLAGAMRSDFVIVGGGGYDAWLYEPVEEQNRDAEIIHALPLTPHEHNHGDHEDHGDHEGHEDDHGEEPNEHVWYDVDAVSQVAQDLADKTGGDASKVTDDMAKIKTRLAGLKDLKVAQTETIADYLIADSPLTDVTPDSYRQAALNHADPSAGDLAAFLDLINSGGLDVLIYNPQTETDLTKSIRAAAEAKNIPVVDIAEIPPTGTDFIDYLHQVVDSLEEVAS